MAKIAIVEDELLQIEQTSAFLARYGEERGFSFEIRTFRSGEELLTTDHREYDLIFMDIDLPGLNGMDCSKRIRESNEVSVIIFITNMANHAVNGYKVRALDFMVKPLTYADFKMTMDRFMASFEAKAPKSVLINVHGTTIKVPTKDILYINMVGHDVNVVKTDGNCIVFRGSMKNVVSMFPGEEFFQITSGSMVNMNHLNAFKDDSVILDNGERLPVSRSRKKELLKALSRFFEPLT